jgi:hypothetical protein
MSRLIRIAIIVVSMGVGLTTTHAEDATITLSQNWKLEKTTKYVDLGNGKGMWSTYEAMVGEDGTHIQTGEGEEKSRNLFYKYRGDTVKILASRYLADGRDLVDVWQVSFGLIVERLRPEYEVRSGDFGIIAKIASAVRQLLPIWPHGAEEEAHPARDVKIGIGGFDRDGRHFRIDIDTIIAHPERYSTFISDRIRTIYLLQR